jgi:hypothetical protein
MEETDMCHLTPTVRALQQAIPNCCPAKLLEPSQRLTLGVQALAGTTTITALAEQFGVSRKFVYCQADTAHAALHEAFSPAAGSDEQVLFYLPVTKAWLRQLVLALILICHSSLRGVLEFWRDLLDFPMALGTVHNILHEAVAQAHTVNQQYQFGNIAIAGLDEIFQGRQPVLVGADVHSTFCFLLSLEEHRDADTWGVRLLELQARGLAPEATIADFAKALRAGQELALPGVPCRGDVFHALAEVTPLVRSLEQRAYEAIAAQQRWQDKKAKDQRRGRPAQASGTKAFLAGKEAAKAMTLADDVAILLRWLRCDILAVSGPTHADRCLLYDFIVAELKAREPLCPHRLGPVCTFLQNQRDHLLAFSVALDRELAELAADFQVSVATVRELLAVQALDERQPQRWHRQAVLQQQLGSRFHRLSVAVQQLANDTVRASSIIENLNSRLRNYFFLRRQLGQDYLVLLQFFLNHRRFLRSEHAERVDKSPAELLTGQPHDHWLQLLGYTPFSRN